MKENTNSNLSECGLGYKKYARLELSTMGVPLYATMSGFGLIKECTAPILESLEEE